MHTSGNEDAQGPLGLVHWLGRPRGCVICGAGGGQAEALDCSLLPAVPPPRRHPPPRSLQPARRAPAVQRSRPPD